MAVSSTCNSFLDCIGANPLPSGAPAVDRYSTLENIMTFAVNLTAYFLYAVLFVYVVYNLVMGIYKLYAAEDQRSFEVIKESITKALMGVLGMIVVSAALFIIYILFGLLGIDMAGTPYDILLN